MLRTCRSAIDGAVNLFLPPHCLNCGVPLPEQGPLCLRCRKWLVHIEEPRCGKCGKPVGEFSRSIQRCDDCRRHPLAFDQGVSPFLYDRTARELILRFKFCKSLLAADIFLEHLAAQLSEMPWKDEIDLVQPVPMHWFKRAWRGYNQATVLAQGLCWQTGLPFSRALVKVRHTQTQSRLSRTERLANLTGAFKVRPAGAVLGRTVLLVDDVMTTGTTCSECARVLKEAGATKVYALTIARAV